MKNEVDIGVLIFVVLRMYLLLFSSKLLRQYQVTPSVLKIDSPFFADIQLVQFVANKAQ